MNHENHLAADALSDEIRRQLLKFGLRPAHDSEIGAARELAAQLIGDVVGEDVLRRVHAYTGAAVYVAYEDDAVAGVYAAVLLNAEGLEAVFQGRFDARSPDLAHIAVGQDLSVGTYGWGIGATRPAAKRVVEACQSLEVTALASLPYFAKPATDAGRRLLCDRLGLVELPGSGGLVWTPDRVARKPAEAA